MPRYDMACDKCRLLFKDFYYPMEHIGTDAVRCPVCGGDSVRQIYSVPTLLTDTNFEPYWDYTAKGGPMHVTDRTTYKVLQAEARAAGYSKGEDYAGPRRSPEERRADEIARHGPAAATYYREEGQREKRKESVDSP